MADIILKRCPFCGCAVEIRRGASSFLRKFTLYGEHDEKCLFGLNPRIAFDNVEYFANLWNRRDGNG